MQALVTDLECRTQTWSALAVGDEGCIAQVVSCCVFVKPSKIMQPMHGIIPFMFDCWTDPVGHLLLLKSSKTQEFESLLLTSNAHQILL